MKKLFLFLTFSTISTFAASAQNQVAVTHGGTITSNVPLDPATLVFLQQEMMKDLQGQTEFIITPNSIREGKKFSVQVGPLRKEDTIIARITDVEGRLIATDSTKVASTNPKLSFIAPAAGDYIALVYPATQIHLNNKIPFTVTERKAKKKSRRGKE